jgi:hypothetical protein
MPREPYVKPEVKSEVVEPEAYNSGGSGITRTRTPRCPDGCPDNFPPTTAA